MWGVIARIAAAAVVVAVVQHHVTQVYNAWQEEREASEDGPRKMFPRSQREAPAGDEKDRGRPGDGSSGGGGSEGGARSFSIASAAALASGTRHRAPSVPSAWTGAHASLRPGASGAVDPRHVRAALSAARRALRA